MVITCAAAFCYNSNVDKQKPVSFFRFPKDVQESNKWSVLIGRHDLLDGKINSQRVCSDHFDKSSITPPTTGSNVRLVNGAMPMKVFQVDKCNELDKSSVIIEKCSSSLNDKEPSNCTCILTSTTQSHSQSSEQISQLISTNTSSIHGGKSRDSENDHKIKFFKFSKDEPCSLMWMQAVNEENHISKNNSMNCNVYLSNQVYKKRLNLLKLMHKAVPSISNPGNCGQNVKPKIIVMNSNLKSSQKADRKSNILSDHTYVCSGNVKLQKMNSNSESKSSQKHVKKYHDKLSDHSYVLKLPASSTPDEMNSGKGTVKNLKLNDKVVNNSCIINITESDKSSCKSTNKSNKRIENSSLVQIDKNSFENSEIDWREIVSAQSIIIKELRKKVKVLQQKIRRHNTKMETLRMKGI